MYHILLVDDDALFANMFTTWFNWNELGFADPCWVEDGRSAISLLQTRSFDLAFIDMCLPNINGPELIAYISRYHPGLTCIALSNHDDFDFVKESFRAGTANYILKHCLNQIEMRSLLEKFCKDKGLNIGAEKQITPKPENTLLGEDPVADYMSAVLTGRYVQTADDSTVTDALGLPLLKKNILVVRFQISDFLLLSDKLRRSGRLHFFLRSVRSMVQSITDRYGTGITSFLPGGDSIWTMVSDDRFASLIYQQHTAGLLAQQVTSAMELYYNLKATVLVAPLCMHINDLYFAYVDIMQQAGEQFDALPPKNSEKSVLEVLGSAQNMLKHYLNYPNFQDTRRYLSSLFERGCKDKFSFSQFLHISTMLLRIYEEYYQSLPEADRPGTHAETGHLISCSKFEELEQYIINAFESIHQILQQNCISQYSVYVQGAIRMISLHFSDPNLSLMTIADSLYVSTSYLSRIFKQETQTGINEYINLFRIERAKSCIELHHMSIRQTAEYCGFENYTYFFRVFKKITGVTPKEYEQQYGT